MWKTSSSSPQTRVVLPSHRSKGWSHCNLRETHFVFYQRPAPQMEIKCICKQQKTKTLTHSQLERQFSQRHRLERWEKKTKHSVMICQEACKISTSPSLLRKKSPFSLRKQALMATNVILLFVLLFSTPTKLDTLNTIWKIKWPGGKVIWLFQADISGLKSTGSLPEVFNQ